MGAVFSHPLQRIDININLDPYFAPDRKQYQATLILARLLRLLPDEGSKIVGITSVDLYIPVLTFVFGQSQLNASGAVVSTFRLHNEYYGLPADEELLFERAIKPGWGGASRTRPSSRRRRRLARARLLLAILSELYPEGECGSLSAFEPVGLFDDLHGQSLLRAL